MTRDPLAIFVICVLYLATLYGAWMVGRAQEQGLTERALLSLERAVLQAEQCMDSHELRNSYLGSMQAEEDTWWYCNYVSGDCWSDTTLVIEADR